MSMMYKVIKISEADFGCEELGPNEKVKALLTVEDSEKNKKTIEYPDDELVKLGIEEGKYIYVSDDGVIRKGIKVVAAVIKAHAGGKKVIFATQRGYGEFKGGWEFPGGKLEEGETPRDALVREIREELDTRISVGELIDTIEYDYPTFHLHMDCFWCEILEGELVLKEHESARWLCKEEMFDVNWLPADITLIEKIVEVM